MLAVFSIFPLLDGDDEFSFGREILGLSESQRILARREGGIAPLSACQQCYLLALPS